LELLLLLLLFHWHPMAVIAAAAVILEMPNHKPTTNSIAIVLCPLRRTHTSTPIHTELSSAAFPFFQQLLHFILAQCPPLSLQAIAPFRQSDVEGSR
jgi:hypothetical protein